MIATCVSRLGIAGAALLLATGALPDSAGADDPTPHVMVSGSGKVSTAPDTADVRVGVVSEAESAEQALAASREAMSRVLRAVEQAGIAAKDVQTEALGVTPRYRRDPQGRVDPAIVGYQATNRVRVVVRDLDALGRTVDELVKRGANQIHGITFSVADPTPLLDRARERAMTDARRKAELYARSAGVRLGRVLSIVEGPVATPQPRMMGRVAMAEATPVAPGELELETHVSVRWALEEP